jgi:hypothetical protein
MNELELLRGLTALPYGVRGDLLDVLTSEPEMRAELIGQFCARDETRKLTEALMDLESDELLRETVIAALRDAPEDH